MPFVHDKRAGDGVHQGGFAGAVGADDGDKFAGRQVQADIVQRQMLVGSAGGKGFGYMGNRQHEAASFRPCFLRRRSRSACLTAGTLSASATTMEEHFADDDAGQADDHDADAGIDIRIALVLRQHCAGKRHAAVGKGER